MLTETRAIHNLLDRYHAATPAQRAQGRDWYPAYQREMRRLAKRHGTTVARAAAVGAITSPNAQLKANLGWTQQILAGERASGAYYRSQAWKCAAALDTANPRPSAFVIGPKVSVFYRAIMGDTDAATIDRWAAHAAGLDRQRPPRKAERAMLDSAYRRAAALVGENVRDFQAIVWTQARETDSGKVYYDLHHKED